MKRHGFIALIVALVLILGATLSYFSDYAKTGTFGEAGTVNIKLTPSVELVDKDGKDILNPGDGRRVDFTVQSLGNKSVDIRETIKLTCSKEMTQTETQAEFELYKTSDVEQDEFDNYVPKSGATPLAVRTVSDDKKTITYQVPDVVLDGNHATLLGNYEVEPEANGKDTEEEAYTLVFRKDSANAYQDQTITIEKLVEAKQHRNTGAGWDLVAKEAYVFGNEDTVSVVPAIEEAAEPEDENEKDVYLKEGPDVNAILKAEFPSVKHIIFTDTKAPDSSVDLSYDENSAVAGWQEGDTLYISSQRAGRKVIAQPNSAEMFYEMTSVEDIDARNLDTSAVTDLSATFMQCSSLSVLDTTGWDTSHVKEFYATFAMAGIGSLPTISSWDTSSAEDFAAMFYGCENLESLNINNWNTSNVTDMNSVFLGVGLSYLDLSNWDVDQVRDCRAMFNGSQLQTLDLSGWQVNQDGYFDSIFSDSQNLENIYASDWRSTTYDYMYRVNMFSGCIKLPNFSQSEISGNMAYPGGYFKTK